MLTHRQQLILACCVANQSDALVAIFNAVAEIFNFVAKDLPDELPADHQLSKAFAHMEQVSGLLQEARVLAGKLNLQAEMIQTLNTEVYALDNVSPLPASPGAPVSGELSPRDEIREGKLTRVGVLARKSAGEVEQMLMKGELLLDLHYQKLENGNLEILGPAIITSRLTVDPFDADVLQHANGEAVDIARAVTLAPDPKTGEATIYHTFVPRREGPNLEHLAQHTKQGQHLVAQDILNRCADPDRFFEKLPIKAGHLRIIAELTNGQWCVRDVKKECPAAPWATAKSMKEWLG